jgi:hypothetical protein
MFKVGDRVWSYRYNKYMWVNEVTSSGCFLADDEKLLINYYHSNCEFHQTADDMFEELGFEKIKEDSRYIIYSLHCYEQGFITELRFDKDKNKYILTNFTNNNNMFAGTFTTDLHLAIHQKLIELGWIK